MSNRVEPLVTNTDLLLRVDLNPPPPYEAVQGYPTSNSNTEQRSHETELNRIINKYEISFNYMQRLELLRAFKIVFIFDDSSSMNTIIKSSRSTANSVPEKRWDELKMYARISIELVNVYNKEGVDVYFLNRPPAKSVKHMNDLEPYFVNPPYGFTPLNRILCQVLSKAEYFIEKNLLVVLITDGEPTNDRYLNC